MKFCTSCGTALSPETTPSQNEPSPPAPEVNESTINNTPPVITNSPIPTKSNNNRIVGCLVILVLLGGLFFVLSKLFPNNFSFSIDVGGASPTVTKVIPTPYTQTRPSPTVQSFLNPGLIEVTPNTSLDGVVQDIPNSPSDTTLYNGAVEPIIIDPTGTKNFSPAQTVYEYIMDQVRKDTEVTAVISAPLYTKNTNGVVSQVAIDVTLDGETKTILFVEKSEVGSGRETLVVMGPANAGGTLFTLQRAGNAWAIVAIEETDL
jgi:hypothetical protein